MGEKEVLNWLRLTRVKGIGPTLVRVLVEKLGSAEAVLKAGPEVLSTVEGIGTVRAKQIVSSREGTLVWAQEELERVEKAGVTLLCFEDEGYPAGLRRIGDPPIVLYVRGKLEAADAVAVGIVGARECTMYGREQAGKFGHDLAAAGLTVVSGGARGIDTCAHQGAMMAKGRTVVVQGCGMLHTYPPENKGLFERIVAEGLGAVVSELPLDAPPAKENFPPRNRIIAGMSLGVLVVEANLRSGSLITARLAAADYGREVFAIPGRVDSPASAGTHHLIKTAAAHLVESAADVLEYLGDVGEILKKQETRRDGPTTGGEPPSHQDIKKVEGELFAQVQPFTSVQEKILGVVGEKWATIDEIMEGTGLAAAVVMTELTMLQLRGTIKRMEGNRVVRVKR